MGLSLHSKIHQCLTLLPVLFLRSLDVPFRIFSFTCIHGKHKNGKGIANTQHLLAVIKHTHKI